MELKNQRLKYFIENVVPGKMLYGLILLTISYYWTYYMAFAAVLVFTIIDFALFQPKKEGE